MATKCFQLLRGRRMRLTRLDGCGRPVYGPDSVVTTKGFISVGLTSDIEEGDAIQVQNASGENCINEPAVPSLNGFGLDISFCDVDPDAMAITTGQEPYLDYAGDKSGFTVDTDISVSDTGFAIELWMGSPVDNCAEGGEGSYGYLLLPFVQGGVLADFSVENAAINLGISNAATKKGNAWGVGPYDVMLDGVDAAPLPTPLTSSQPLLLTYTQVAPPEPACGARPLLDPANPVATSVTATMDDLSATVAAVPSNAAPFWADFGDGTWDYAEVGTTPLVHEYDAPGTYTVTLHRGTSTVTTSAVATAP